MQEFFATATQPTLGLRYTKLGYQPMRELLDMLRARGFIVFICSGGGRDFMRPVSEQMYGIPRERVIGSATTVQYRDGELYRTEDVEQPIGEAAASRNTSGRVSGASRCWPAATPTATLRCS